MITTEVDLRLGESIVFDECTVKLYKVRPGECKFAIDAPRNVTIIRSELLEQQKGDSHGLA